MTRSNTWDSSFTALALVVSCAILISSCGGSDAAAGVAHATGQTRASGPALAAAAASKLLANEELLPLAVRVARPPSAVHGLLDHPAPHEAFAHVIDLHIFLISSLAPATLLRFFSHHVPRGTRVLGGGRLSVGKRSTYWWEELNVPSNESTIQPQRLNLAIAAVGQDEVAVRVDARVAWHLEHSPSFHIPSTARWLTIDVVRTYLVRGHGEHRRTVQLLPLEKPRSVATIIATVNALPVYEPTNPLPSCPAGGGSGFALLTFRSIKNGPILASARVYPRYCASEVVRLMLPHEPAYALTGSTRLLGLIEREVGRRLLLP